MYDISACPDGTRPRHDPDTALMCAVTILSFFYFDFLKCLVVRVQIDRCVRFYFIENQNKEICSVQKYNLPLQFEFGNFPTNKRFATTTGANLGHRSGGNYVGLLIRSISFLVGYNLFR